jgi:hypothetical protein
MSTDTLHDAPWDRRETNDAEIEEISKPTVSLLARAVEYFLRLVVVVLGLILGILVAFYIAISVGWYSVC